MKLNDAEHAAANLRTLLATLADIAALDSAFKQVTQSCVACHKTHRNK